MDNVTLGFPTVRILAEARSMKVSVENFLFKGSTIGDDSTILPGVEIGEGAMVAAGALVTKDVPEWSLAIGFPAKIQPLPKWLKNYNRI